VPRPDIPARRTKIVATIGPASDDPATLVAMADAGMNVARIPLAHGTTEEALARIERVRAAIPDVGILADLPGPKIRAAPFTPEGVVLVPKSDVTLVAVPPATASTADRIGVADAALVARLEPGDRVAIGDGGIALDVRARTADGVVAEVRSGGTVLGRPGITVVNDRFEWESPTPEDLERMAALAAVRVDAVAASFVRSAADIEALRAAWSDRPDCEIVVYPEADHGFVHAPERPAHRADDAADAWRRVLAFLLPD